MTNPDTITPSERAKTSWWELVEHTDNGGIYVLTRTGGTIVSVCDLNLFAEGVVRDEQGAIREDWTQYVYYLSRAYAPWARNQPWRVLDRARKPVHFTPLKLPIRAWGEGVYPLPSLTCRYCGQTSLGGSIRPEGFVYYPVACRTCGHGWEKGEDYQVALLLATRKRNAAARRKGRHQTEMEP